MNNLNEPLIKRLNLLATVISVVVLLLVAFMRKLTIYQFGDTFKFLPGVYACFNVLCAGFLVAALYYIKQKNIVMHQRMIYVALTFSTLFLLLYVLYHITTPDTPYCKTENRGLYFSLLISHVVCAAGSFPFILFTFVRGFTGQIEKHKRMSKYVFWVWLYVAISGPIVYLMLKDCY